MILADKYEVPVEDEYFDEDYYDAQGNCSPGGMYDAGGHAVSERWAAWADDMRDQMRDRDE